jgi:SAM-dependent methyltransferase
MGETEQRWPAGTLWADPGDFEFMRRDGREQHSSRQAVLRRLERQFAGRTASMLDVGVLSAVMADDLAGSALDVNYAGIDISPAIIDDCRRRHPELDWRVMSVMDLAFDDRSFDLVHCRHVIEHLPYFETAVRELARVTAELMVLCLFIPAAEEEILRRKKHDQGYVWVNQYRAADLEKLLGDLFSRVDFELVQDGNRPNAIYYCQKLGAISHGGDDGCSTQTSSSTDACPA